MKNMNENHFAALLVAGTIAFVFGLVRIHPDIEIGSVTGMHLFALALYTAYWTGMLAFLGGIGVKVVQELRANPVATAILAGLLALGAAMTLSGM